MTGPGEFEISLFMVGDWRVGTGTGVYGYADRLVQRDTKGTFQAPAAPIVPAKTLIGVWRDSCELAAHALDGGPAGVWHDWLGFLFGGQYATATSVLRPAALVIEGPLRLGGRLAELLREKPLIAWAATFRKPGVAIDARTGTARADMLRFEETARAGVTLEGRGRIDGFAELDQAGQEAAVALLGAGARLLETIGGRRRRGSGRCVMTLGGPAPDWAVLERDQVVPPPSAAPYAVADRPAPAPPAAETGWERVELLITVEQAVLAAATVLGNVVRGASRLPGWCLMPEVTRRLGGAAHALVRTGDLLVTAATPLTERGAGTLPVPRVLVHGKGDSAVIGNRMVEAVPAGKPYRDGYVVPEGAETHAVVTPPFTLRMHNSVQDDVQRPTRKVGGVYIYQALAAGTVLRAEVRVRAGLLTRGWESRLAGTWRVGRSSKDDYGQVRVEARRIAERRRRRSGGHEDLLRVWLLSELLVRDRRLRPSTAVEDVGRALEQAVNRAGAAGVSLKPVTGRKDGRVGVALGVHRTESWHRGWGLPRPTLYGPAAGSCLTFEVIGGPVDPEILAELGAAGVGERRAEGFGQVEFDHPLLLRPVGRSRMPGEAPSAGTPPTPSVPADAVSAGTVPIGTASAGTVSIGDVSPGDGAGGTGADDIPLAVAPELIAPGEAGHTEARIFERVAWRAEIHRACERIKGDPARRSEVIPAGVSSTQLNALREVTREPSAARADSRLQWLVRPKAGRPAWPEAAVSSLRELFTVPDRVWTLLGLPQEELVVTRDGAEALRAELHREAVRVLVDVCLAAHAREKATATAVRGDR